MLLDDIKQKVRFLLFTTSFLFCPLSAQNMDFFSQCGQDKFLYENFFKDKKSGIFVDIGAHDGITYSNTYFLEKSLGWQGICIEPNPDVFAQLISNRTAQCIQGCISNNNEIVSFLKVSGYPEMLSGIVSNYDPRHLARIETEIQLYGGSYEIIPIQCYRLNEILAANQITYVDYLSLDIEGGELEVLKSIDYDKFEIEIIDVENNYMEPDMKEFMESKGYSLVTVIGGQDEIYLKNR